MDDNKKAMPSKQIHMTPQSTCAPSLKAYAYRRQQAGLLLIRCILYSLRKKGKKCHISSLRFTDFNPVNRLRRLDIYTVRAFCSVVTDAIHCNP